ncbi:MAG: hypothetical protein E6064_01165 [Peptoniphilus harei]|nr:hypothetical protein [Peptoniphilus harei]
MDIFDVLSKKISYRRFSKREKTLFVIFILLFLEFLFYNFLIKNEKQKISEIQFNESIESEKINYKYSGLENFSKENIDKIVTENNLEEENIAKEAETDIETLSISGIINNGDIGKISKLTNYYGYSNITLNRNDENTFNFEFKAEKPSKTVYYSDLKSAYFNEKNSSNLNNKESEKENLNSKDDKKDKNITDIKNIKATELQSTNKKIMKNLTLKGKESLKTNNKDNVIKGHEEKLSNLNGVKDNIDNKAKDKLESNHNNLDLEINKNEENKFIVDNNVNTNYYSESGIISIFVDKEKIYDIIKLGVNKHCNGISLSLLFPYDSCKEIGIINLAGEKIPFTGKILQNEWFRINLFTEDISYIYFLPQNNEDLFFFIKEVEYNENI